MRIDSAGNVGIGTANPTAPLDISGDNGSGRVARFVGVNGGSFQIQNVSNDLVGIGATGAGDELALLSSNTERARLDSSGRLLVGTSSDITNYTLQVANTTGNNLSLMSFSSTASDGAYLTLNHSKSGTVGTQTLVSNGDLLGTTRFRGSDGTVFLDGATISAEVDGTPGANDMPGRLVFSTTADGASSPTERFSILNDGTICPTADSRTSYNNGDNATTGPGIKAFGSGATTTVPYEGMCSNTATRYHLSFSNPNGIVGSISTNGSATAFNTSSDYRLKENVVPLTGAADRLNQLQVRRFNFIADPDTTVDGFIAHEAQAVVPEAVTGTHDEVDADGNPVYQGIDQSKLVPLLTAALQEALAEIESLKARVTALEP
jgi:hypothetical protein